jgi:hypothetical protein
MAASRTPNQKLSCLRGTALAETSAGVSRRLASISLLCAWLCASGAMLDVAQGFAWTRMFAGYSRTESVASAARDTFDPARPCRICLAVKAARDASCTHCPVAQQAETSKIVLAFEEPGIFVGQVPSRVWPSVMPLGAPARPEDVPLPPPRADC